MRTILLTTLALSFAASSAMAATRTRVMLPAAAAQAYASANNTNTVIKEGKVRGTDPDPYVRFELNRESDPANIGGQ